MLILISALALSLNVNAQEEIHDSLDWEKRDNSISIVKQAIESRPHAPKSPLRYEFSFDHPGKRVDLQKEAHRFWRELFPKVQIDRAAPGMTVTIENQNDPKWPSYSISVDGNGIPEEGSGDQRSRTWIVVFHEIIDAGQKISVELIVELHDVP